MRHVNRISLVAAMLIVSGCASNNVKRNWDCPVQDGIGCKSILESTQQIIGQSTAVNPTGLSGVRPQYSANNNLRIYDAQGVPKWESDQIMKVYISPFIDSASNYHDESVIFTVVRDGDWSE